MADVSAAIQCAVCNTTYTNPRSLHCGHSFCQNCIHPLITGGSLACPTCSRETHVTRVTELPMVFALIEVIAALSVGGGDPGEAKDKPQWEGPTKEEEACGPTAPVVPTAPPGPIDIDQPTVEPPAYDAIGQYTEKGTQGAMPPPYQTGASQVSCISQVNRLDC